MAQTKEQNQAPAAANASGEKRPRTSRRPHYTRRPRRPQQPKEAATPIHIYPLGGLGEVGKNMTVYECCGDMIIVDCGLVFPDRACSSPTAMRTTSAASPICCRSSICPSTAPA